MTVEQRNQIRKNAYESVKRFSDEEFDKKLISVINEI